MNNIKFVNNYKSLSLLVYFSLTFIFLSACDQQIETNVVQQPVSPVSGVNTTAKIENSAEQNITVENKSYLFDVTDHTLAELEALLARAEEVSMAQSPDYDDLEIVMIIHGPDIEWFTQQNYAHNKKLIDLAKRLDAYDIIDMKVCEKTMKFHGVEREDIPEFIDSVPYAPIEIKNRLRDGYINL